MVAEKKVPKQMAQKTFDDLKEQEKKLDGLEQTLDILELISTGMMILFAASLFLSLICITEEYLAEMFSEIFAPHTGAGLILLFLISSAIVCISIIEKTLKQYSKERTKS